MSGDCCCCNGGVIFKSVKLQSVNLDGCVSVPSTVYCKSRGISFCSQSSMYLCNGGIILKSSVWELSGVEVIGIVLSESCSASSNVW